MKRIKRNIITCFTAVGMLLLNGCHAPTARQAVTLDQEAFMHHIQAVYLMPIIDARDDKSATFDDADQKLLLVTTKSQLEEHGYQVILEDSWGDGMLSSDQGLGDMGDSELAAIAPSNSGVFFVINVDDIDDHYPSLDAPYYSITVTLTAIDRQKKAAIWKDADAGITGYGGGLVGSLFSPANSKEGAQDAVLMQLFDSLPVNQK